MRPLVAIAALCLAASTASARTPDVHVSQGDRDEIRAVIRAATRAPILRLTPYYDSRRVAGSIPVKIWLKEGRNGRVKPTPLIAYERTDKVRVQTGFDANPTGGSYVVQKVGGKWQIIGKKYFWIH